MRRAIFIVSFIFLFITTMTAQDVKNVPAKYTPPTSGAEMYRSYCASCHGLDMRGDGPAARSLKNGVPDLTQMAKKNRGKFPSERVAQMIVGESLVAAHGSKGMPVWGPAFLAMDQRDRGVVQLRAKNLARHIEEQQGK